MSNNPKDPHGLVKLQREEVPYPRGHLDLEHTIRWTQDMVRRGGELGYIISHRVPPEALDRLAEHYSYCVTPFRVESGPRCPAFYIFVAMFGEPNTPPGECPFPDDDYYLPSPIVQFWESHLRAGERIDLVNRHTCANAIVSTLLAIWKGREELRELPGFEQFAAAEGGPAQTS